MPLYEIPKDHFVFPHPSLASQDGLLAVGGDLSPERLILAYQNGIFPWYGEDEPILWWCLTPRLVLFPEQIIVSKSMRRCIAKKTFHISMDTCFEKVMSECRAIRRLGQKGSWIHYPILEAYSRLHDMGIAHSVEVWQDNKLVGGLYGLAIGKMFCGESMFAHLPNASKFALIHLATFLKNKGFTLIDCQQDTAHLQSMGAELLSNVDFFNFLEKNKKNKLSLEFWAKQNEISE